jgi:enterochelin esterase-like enzyme
VQGLTAAIVQMQDELRETILPYIVGHYSTYAKDGSIESLQKARSHFGLGGLSNGAWVTYEGGMRHDFDLFGSYCAFSGNGEPWKTVSAIQSGDFANLPVDCLFTGAGSMNDWQQNYTKIGFEHFVEKDSRFVEGETAWRVDVEGSHEWKVWYTCLYNAMQVMFQSPGD